ncbi:MAG: glycosyltransferase [Candidatus Scalindua sp.]|nr:glycosyltransferase [Candidatus Scalindua sp.]
MNNTNKPKIINIMPHGPAYSYSPDEKPDVWWEKSNGNLLGFWTREWPNLLGAAVLKQTDQYEWEVWQPDYRADKIYSRRLKTGVVYKLFPAQEKMYRSGLKTWKDIHSGEIISRLSSLRKECIYLQLHGFPSALNIELLSLLGPKKRYPIFLVTHCLFLSPLKELFGLHRPLTYLDLLVRQKRYYRSLQYVDVVGGQNQASLNNIQMVYSGRVEKLHMGCDFDFWIPIPSDEIKKNVRKKLSISDNRTVFLATGNFVSLKQFDKLIKAFQKLSDREEFLLIIAGHGNKQSTDYLSSLAGKLILQNKVIIHPYITGEPLRNLYWASDVYISVATNEGGPVSVMKAMACGLPLLSTPTGDTGDMMKKHGVGRFVPIKHYDEWTNAISEILGKELPKPLDIEIARAAYDWPNIAERFINIYDDLRNIYY